MITLTDTEAEIVAEILATVNRRAAYHQTITVGHDQMDKDPDVYTNISNKIRKQLHKELDDKDFK